LPDIGREPLVVYHHRHRRPASRAFLVLLGVERAPLRTLINEVVIDHKTAAAAGHFTAIIVADEVLRITLGAGSNFLKFNLTARSLEHH
jgi:hypothetical protein